MCVQYDCTYENAFNVRNTKNSLFFVCTRKLKNIFSIFFHRGIWLPQTNASFHCKSIPKLIIFHFSTNDLVRLTLRAPQLEKKWSVPTYKSLPYLPPLRVYISKFQLKNPTGKLSILHSTADRETTFQ